MGQVEVSAADIARIAGVGPSAVSNWRRRHEDFPSPVNGSDRNPRFELAAVEEWLHRQGKTAEVSPDERLWHAFELARGAMPTSRALVSAGLLLTYLRRHPERRCPPGEAGLQRVLSEAEHALAFGQGTQAAGVIGLRKREASASRARRCCTPSRMPSAGTTCTRLRVPVRPRIRRGREDGNPRHAPGTRRADA